MLRARLGAFAKASSRWARLSTIASCRLLHDGRALEVLLDDDHSFRFHAFWLRDNAASTRMKTNGQRLVSVNDLLGDERISTASVMDGGMTLTVTFASDEASCYPVAWLTQHAYDRPRREQRVAAHVELWDASINAIPHEDLPAMQADPSRLASWLDGMHRYGCAKLSGGRAEAGALFEVIELFGYVRETNYGRHFDVKTKPNPANLADSALSLQAHTDNPYRDPAPTVQLLYCIENSCDGGENTLVDGFAAAVRLLREDPNGFRLLAGFPACFAYEQKAASEYTRASLHSRKPMIALAVDGTVESISFNNRSIAPLSGVPYEHMIAYYDAYKRFSRIIDDPSMTVSFKLKPGEAFLVDNRRVLHGRRAFDASNGGSRWLQGCYADVDGLYSTLRLLRAAAHGSASANRAPHHRCDEVS